MTFVGVTLLVACGLVVYVAYRLGTNNEPTPAPVPVKAPDHSNKRVHYYQERHKS